MPQRIFPIPPKTIGAITGVLLLSSLILILWARGGGPVWTSWLGGTFLGCLLLIPGVLYLFDPQLSISWFRAMKPRRRDGGISKPLLWSQLKKGEQIMIFIGIMIVSFIGFLILSNTIPVLLGIWGIV